MTENELATVAVDVCYKIHTTHGPELLESVYDAAFDYELTKRNVAFTRQHAVEVPYDNIMSDIGFRADIITEEKLVVEIKSVELFEKVHHKTVITYLKVSGMKLGILVNFKVNLIKEGIHRKINGEID